MSATGVCALHDVPDVYAVCRRVLDSALRRNGGYLRPVDYEDAVQFLAIQASELAKRYDPARGLFSTYLEAALPRRVVEWYRAEFGRNGNRLAPAGSLSLDEMEEGERDALLAPVSADDDADEAPFDFSSLTLQSRRIAALLMEGFSSADIARFTGRSPKDVARATAQVAEELVYVGQVA